MASKILKRPIEYPRRRSPLHKSKMVFQAVKVTAPSATLRFSASQTADETTGSGSVPQRTLANVKGGGNTLKTHIIGGEGVSLFVPVGFSVSDNMNYNEASLGTAGAVVATGINQGLGIGGSALKAIQEAGNSIFDFFRGMAGSGDLSRLAAVRGADLVPGIPDNVRSAIGLTARVTLNPNIRTQFQGVGIREFSFNLKFIPNSPEESADVKNIIKFFRFHSYPEEIGQIGSFSAGYDYPNMFKIRLLSEGENGIFKNIGTPIKLCYLKSVQHVYNPTSAVLHSDGSPTEIDLTLSFTEYKALSRKDVINEDDDIFYHFETGRANASIDNGAIEDNFGGGD